VIIASILYLKGPKFDAGKCYIISYHAYHHTGQNLKGAGKSNLVTTEINIKVWQITCQMTLKFVDPLFCSISYMVNYSILSSACCTC